MRRWSPELVLECLGVEPSRVKNARVFVVVAAAVVADDDVRVSQVESYWSLSLYYYLNYSSYSWLRGSGQTLKFVQLQFH